MKTVSGVTVNYEDIGYNDLLRQIQSQFDKSQEQPLFLTTATGLFDIFLGTLPEELRQYYTCHACRDFVEKYGGLVTIDDAGQIKSAIWPYVDGMFTTTVHRLRKAVEASRVVGVFHSNNDVFGKPVTGEWHHLALNYNYAVDDATEIMALKHEEYMMLKLGVNAYSLQDAEQALSMLRSGALQRSEKVIDNAVEVKQFRSLC